MKEATVVDPNALKNSSYEYFEFYFKKMVKNRLLQRTIKKSKKIVYSTSKIENKTRKRELSSAFSELQNIHFFESYGSLKLSKEKALKIRKNLLLHFAYILVVTGSQR